MILESIPREKRECAFFNCSLSAVSEVKLNMVSSITMIKLLKRILWTFESYHGQTKTSEELPFNGGAIGFVGYDLIGLYENIGSIPEDTIGTQISTFSYMSYVIFDHKKKEKVYGVEENLYSGRSEAEQASSLEKVLEQLARPTKGRVSGQDLHALHFHNHLEQKRV